MKVIFNKYIPFRNVQATNLFGIVFVRSDRGKFTEALKNHEYIHTLQQKEMLYVFFFLWYNIEWFFRFLKCHDWNKAYGQIYFEREAYSHMRDLDYTNHRRHFAWWHEFVKEDTFLHELGCCLGDVVAFIKEDFKWAKYLYVMLIACVIAVAQIKFNIYGILLSPSFREGTSMIRFPMVHIALYFMVLIPSLAVHGELWRMKRWQAWVFPVFLLLVNGMGIGFNAYKGWIAEGDYTGPERFYLLRISAFLFRSVFVLLMISIFKWISTGRFGLYGLVRSAKYIRIYIVVFLLLLPIFVIVSTTPQFLSYYPKMALDRCTGSFGLNAWQLVAGFELCYANDFLCVESMFRGAMIIGLSKWLGPRAVLPMIITYMSIHLGKPDLELCSSVVGAYLLGALAYKTKHLWGGIIIHLGIAMFFEALGLIHLML